MYAEGTAQQSVTAMKRHSIQSEGHPKRTIRKRFIVTLAAMTLLSAICVTLASARPPVMPPRGGSETERSRFAQQISAELKKSGTVYLYFFNGTRESSRKWQKPVEDWAKGRKVSFLAVDAESNATRSVAEDYGIMYLPTVLRLRRGYGVVEAFTGPRQVEKFAATFPVGKIPAFAKPVSDSTKKGRSVVIEFYAEWCMPCREMVPLLEQVEAKSGGRIKVLRVNVDGEMDGVRLYGVEGPPQHVLLDPYGAVRKRFDRIDRAQTLLDYAKTIGLL
jgi:thioredoxin-like negative regulator of GroEL